MNVLLLKAWLAENADGQIGTRLRDVRQLDAKSFAVQLGAGWLLVSILEGYPTLALLAEGDELLRGEATESGFVKALRFQLAGATLMSIDQQGFDRSVLFEFSRKDIYGRETQRTLRVELVGRASNAYLLNENGVVISIFKHVPAGRNSVRRVMTGKPLPAPPPLGKFIAAESGEDGFAAKLQQAALAVPEDPIRELLTRHVAGGDVQLWESLEPLAPAGGDQAALYQFIQKLQCGEFNCQLFGPSANRATLESWLTAKTAGSPSAKQRDRSAGHDNRTAQIQAQLATAMRAEGLERLGLDMLQRAPSKSSREAAAAFLKGWQLAHPEWSERVDVSKSAEENAGALIEYAQRLKRARPKLEQLLTQAHTAEVAFSRPATQGKPQIDPLQRDIAKLERNGVKYLRYVTSDGLAILVGQSDRSNDELVRHYGSSRHLWLHVRDYPGSHVLLLTNGRDVPTHSLEEAAIVAGYYSQGRGEIDLDISYTPVKQLRRPKGGKPGQLLKLSERVIRVNPMRFESLRDSMRVSSILL